MSLQKYSVFVFREGSKISKNSQTSSQTSDVVPLQIKYTQEPVLWCLCKPNSSRGMEKYSASSSWIKNTRVVYNAHMSSNKSIHKMTY